MSFKDKLLKIIEILDDRDVNNAYFHRNYDTGEVELNIELHKISVNSMNQIQDELQEIDSCAFWE